MKRVLGDRELAAVIFDVDGTLYDHDRLKLKVVVKLLAHAAAHPLRGIKDVLIIKRFRARREELAKSEAPDFLERQYGDVAGEFNVPEERVRELVAHWLFAVPDAMMASVKYPHLDGLIEALSRAGIATGVFSDYPTEGKLEALGLRVDAQANAEEPEIARLKPHPAGLARTAARLGAAPEACLYVGDRADKDLACAERAGMACALVGRGDGPRYFSDYGELARELGPWLG